MAKRTKKTDENTEALEQVQVQTNLAILQDQTQMTIELSPPGKEMIRLLMFPDKILEDAKEITIESDDEYRLADEQQSAWKREAVEIESGRTAGAGPLTRLKKLWDNPFTSAANIRKQAALLVQQTMTAYRVKRKADEAAKNQEAEKLAREETERLRSEAEAARAKAAKLKSPAKKEALLEEAAKLEQTAEMMPQTFTAPPQVSLTSDVSSAGGKWVGEVTDPKLYLGYLIENDDFLGMVVKFMQSGLNAHAKSVKNNKVIPGFKATDQDVYRNKPVK
jgi:hypothetical protein